MEKLTNQTQGNSGGYEFSASEQGKEDLYRANSYNEGWSIGQRENNPEFWKLLDKLIEPLDDESLKDIFSKYLSASGISLEHANFAALRNIHFVPEEDELVVAFYNGWINALHLNVKSELITAAFEEYKSNGFISPNTSYEIELILFHEATHALSRNRYIGQDGKFTSESGFHKNETTQDSSNKLFKALNEGVTQRIAEEVFVKYAERAGNRDAVDFLRNFIDTQVKTQQYYKIYENQVDSICRRIGESIGIPKEVVWSAFVREYFEHGESALRETAELFADVFDENFLDRYSAMGPGTNDSELDDFERSAGIEHLSEYAHRWQQQLGIARKL